MYVADLINKMLIWNVNPGPEVIKLFFLLNPAAHEIYPAHKYLNTNNFNI